MRFAVQPDIPNQGDGIDENGAKTEKSEHGIVREESNTIVIFLAIIALQEYANTLFATLYIPREIPVLCRSRLLLAS